MFKLVSTFKKPAAPQNAQRGQPAPGSGAQQTNPARKHPNDVPWFANIEYQGENTWFNPGGIVDAQRGQPAATAPAQARPPGSVVRAVPDGRTTYRETREFSRGMERYAPITGILMQDANPGSWVPAKPRVVPNYPLGQYINNTIFFANQVIPTTVPLAGLQTQRALAAILSTFVVYGEDQAV